MSFFPTWNSNVARKMVGGKVELIQGSNTKEKSPFCVLLFVQIFHTKPAVNEIDSYVKCGDIFEQSI